MDVKRIKDPAYGYITIPKDYVLGIVDTPLFQRLRRIIQTSYCSLYPSATHTRFAHSLGVYYLGDLAANCIIDNSLPSLCNVTGDGGFVLSKCKRYLEIFRLACLLHDIGHAPFSHTGEEFYSRGENDANGCEQGIDLIELLQKAIGEEENLKAELVRHRPSSANHEIMSAIVGIEQFNLLDNRDEKEFFARAITGYLYDDESLKRVMNGDGINLSFLNCLISILNSSVVDVDRLDYVIRDAKVMGFESVSLDYHRLLSGMLIVRDGNSCKVVYTKQAVGILENVVFAHDAEKKWVQNHPTIGYEMHLLTRAIDEVRTAVSKKLFSKEALLVDGITVGSLKIRLLSDDDLVFLMKNLQKPSDDVKRFFDRKLREHPLWKSEAEFESLFDIEVWSEKDQASLQVLFDFQLESLGKLSSKGHRIDNASIAFLKEDAEDSVEITKTCENEVKASNEKISHRKQLIASLAEVFMSFAKEHDIDCEFLIQEANPFKSGFAKADLGDTLVKLDVSEDLLKLRTITPLLYRNKQSRLLRVFYVFSPTNSNFKRKWASELVNNLRMFVVSNSNEISKYFKSEIETLFSKK